MEDKKPIVTFSLIEEEDVETITDNLDLTKVDLEEFKEDVSYYYGGLARLYRVSLGTKICRG